MDGWVGGWMGGWVGVQRRDKEEGRLEHKELPAKVVITVVLTAVPTPGWCSTDDVSQRQGASQRVHGHRHVPGTVLGPSMDPLS